jgi:hypothetical protein
MARITYTKRVYEYDFPRPKMLTEFEFEQMKRKLPIEPNIEVWSQFLKEEGGTLLSIPFGFLAPTIWMDGSIKSAFNRLSMLKKKKKFFEDYFKAIFDSENYGEYFEKYNILVPIELNPDSDYFKKYIDPNSEYVRAKQLKNFFK